ncbi:phosphatidylglycerol lysyltransferase domain-containing protein [Domibacillus robiginosus]|uniref:phosphatidylglycerol lysyltransferase domain-containing protein n=1 Tax=Domibacillus robiginosus TaxID=1071054 RepID=UPI00067CF0A5|nr:phosphatidylglycerol lysyltransferase domain-containing protein [Domibacillus robiginosus]
MLLQYENDLNEVWLFLQRNGGNHASHLSFLNDKRFFWSQQKQVLIIYQKAGNAYIVLGDPIGKESLIYGAIHEFHKYCRQINMTPVFYQVSIRYMAAYQELGYGSLKIGEEAKVYLPDFSLSGNSRKRLRTCRNKFEREGYQFSVLFPPHSKELLEEIKEVSDAWLGSRKEKGFSVGYFYDDYVARFPLGIVKNQNEDIIAFATLAYNQPKIDRTLVIDLMRYQPEKSPNATMDFLFISIFNWCKEQGYEWCSMGISPLANMKDPDQSGMYEAAGQIIFDKVNHFYNFKGLYQYKNKFQPKWESRYLVYQSNFLPAVFLRIIRLIHANQVATMGKFILARNPLEKLKFGKRPF